MSTNNKRYLKYTVFFKKKLHLPTFILATVVSYFLSILTFIVYENYSPDISNKQLGVKTTTTIEDQLKNNYAYFGITGIIYDELGNRVPKAEIFVDGKIVYSDNEGKYSFVNNFEKKLVKIEASKNEFQPNYFSANVEENQIVNFDIVLNTEN